jgi:uncharacterized protein YjbI with pentapeptide repeats
VSEELPPVRCDDPGTWRHKGQKIDLPRLLQFIEENEGPEDLDLHGADLSNLDARPLMLREYAAGRVQQHEGHAGPAWLWRGGGINLGQAHLERARLDDAQLQNSRLVEAHLDGADLAFAHLENAFALMTHFSGADMQQAHFEYCNLVRAELQGAQLLWAHLEGALLTGADLREADLYRACLEGADLRRARLQGTLWYGARLDRTLLYRQSLGPAIGDESTAKSHAGYRSTFHAAREAYLALKTNFDSIGRYDDASWAYIKEQQMEKAMHFPTTTGHRWFRRELRAGARRWRRKNPSRLWRFVRASILSRLHWAWLHTRLFLGLSLREVKEEMARRSEDGRERDEWLSRRRWGRNWAYELLTGYGERPHMPVIWAGVVILLFALIYAAAGNIAAGDVGALEGQPTHSPITALVHSISAFATIGFNTLEPVGWGARLLTALEAMFGIALFALFVFTLGNRMRRS